MHSSFNGLGNHKVCLRVVDDPRLKLCFLLAGIMCFHSVVRFGLCACSCVSDLVTRVMLVGYFNVCVCVFGIFSRFLGTAYI